MRSPPNLDSCIFGRFSLSLHNCGKIDPAFASSLFNEYKNSNRGIILSSAIFIEIIEKLEPNHIYLHCGS